MVKKQASKQSKGETTAARGRPITRRKFLGAAGVAAAGAAAASNLTIFSRQAKAADRLRVLTWTGYEEKVVIEEFEDTHGVKVDFKTYVGEEQMLQFFNQSPPGTYDTIVLSPEYVRKLNAIDALEPFDPKHIPELANFHPSFRKIHHVQAEGGKIWGIATRFSFYALSYNTNEMSFEESQDWNSLFLPKFKKRVGIFDWYLPNMGNASLAVHPNKENPYDLTDDQLQNVRAWLMKLRPQVNSIPPSTGAIVQQMVNGDVTVAMVGDLDINLKLAGFDNFKSTIPKQGGILWTEVAVLCKQSTNKELALEWITYMSQPHVQAKLVFTKLFKARAPNLKVVEHWTKEQSQLMGYYPDPNNPGQMLVETNLAKSAVRDLPVQQPEKKWIDIFNAFKTG
jgi:spermidine/putrescine transport system substrate-binding protein